MKILITGGTGMLGRSVNKLFPDAIVFSSKQIDLKIEYETRNLFARLSPDVVIHLAGRIGGVKDNSEFPYDYYIENNRINTNVVHCCLKFNVPKLIAMSSTCVYPKKTSNRPMTEDMIYEGNPEETNFAYAHAKRGMQAQIDAARIQFGKKWTVLYSSNLYGPNDHFELQRSHVIPALIYKIHKAKQDNSTSVELLGDGSPLRQFTYVDDMANMIKRFVDNDLNGNFNFCHEQNYSIREVVEMLVKIIGYNGSIEWNGKLNGIFKKDVSCDKLRNVLLDQYPSTIEPENGLVKTYDWYKNNITNE